MNPRIWFFAFIPLVLPFLYESGDTSVQARTVWQTFQDTTRTGGTGRPSRRTMALQRKLGTLDSTAARLDSLLIQTLAARRDSSARIAQFHHVRRDRPAVDPLLRTVHSLYLGMSSQIRTVETLDSAEYVYRVRLVQGTHDIRIPLTFSLDEYRDLRLKRVLRKNWEALARSYELSAEQKQGLGDVFSSITNIQIPVPKNPLFSIFGKNVINIQINGSVDIHAAFRNTKSDLVTTNILDQSRSEPDFDQQVRVGVKGEIGDKLRIDADWDTERTFEYENQLKVRYTGYEDEIIKSIEAGNVSLQTNSSFISSSQALFGVKSELQFGPLKLTAIASQKRGQVKELSVSSGQRATPFEKKPYEYSKDHFFIDTLYRSLYDEAYAQRPLKVNTAYQILDIEVWVSQVESVPVPGKDRNGVALIDRDSVIAMQGDSVRRASEIPADPGRVEIARFMKLTQGTDYTLNPYLGVITLNRSLLPTQVVAAAYTLPERNVGTFESEASETLPLVLKLIRPKNLQPNMKPAWDLMLKNIYPLGGRDIVEADFSLDIDYQLSGAEAVSEITAKGQTINLLNLLGLDNYTGGTAGPDSKFDFEPGITVDQKRGEIIFPSLEPFGDGLRKRFVELLKPADATELAEVLAIADSFAVDLVYDTTYNGAQNAKSNRLSITGSIVSGVQSKFNLGFNVAEGSVVVKVNGQVVRSGSDYSVDYLTGTVVIQNPSYLTPGTSVNIEYEANDLFQLASKSLMGARGELSVSKSSALGFTIMNLNQQTLSDKVRLGEEPISNTIMGVDGSTSLELDFLTRALNWLPGIRTNAVSTLALKGEAAYMLPDPNTRKSTISQDQDVGVAYVDDFEGARRTIPLGVAAGMWRDASVPAYVSTIDPYQPPDGFVNLSDPLVRQNLMVDTSKMEFKSKLIWYSIEPSDVYVADIWPTRQTRSASEDFVPTLSLFMNPGVRGAFNYSLNLQDSLFAQPSKAWAGIMRPLGSIATNLLDENITFVELWIRVQQTSPGAKLNINLGTLSEDIIPNRILNTEDGLGGVIKTGIIQESQDLGLDMLTDDQERDRYAAFVGSYPEYSPDPSGDNYVLPDRNSLLPSGYSSMFGSQGNTQADAGKFADTEDFNNNNVVDRTDSYFEYEIALDTASVDFQKYVTGGEPNTGWYQIRIPIKESTRMIGSPSLTNIESVRLWLTGSDDDVHVRITEFNLVGNQWEAVDKNDDNFRLSSVNIEENPFYTSPPGVKRPIDRTRPDQTIEGNEQSLALQITDMGDGESKRAVKKLIARPLDMFNYRTMKLFVHGDDRPGFLMQYVDTSNYDAEFFIRFGSDSLNYYEYRAPIRPGWHPDNWITIRFADLTALKLGRDSANAPSKPVPVPGGADGSTYRVLGNPALTKITEIVLGVENPTGKGVPFVTGEVWVNELRLSDVDDTPGWAYRTDATMRLADVATVSFGMTRRDPFFHSLENRFGTRTDDQNWSLNSNVSLEKFLPESWRGSRASLSYSHVEVQMTPRYVPGTDILVDEAAKRSAQTAKERGGSEAESERLSDVVRQQSRSLTVTETFSLPSVQLAIPSSSWLINETINRLNVSYSFSDTKRRDPVTQSYHTWLWNFRLTYGLQFSPQNFLQPFAISGDFFLLSPWKGLKLFFLPRSLNVGTTLVRQQTREQVRSQTSPKPVGRSFESTRQMSFSWPLAEGGLINPSIDYTLDVASTLVHLEVDEFGRQRSFSEILGDMFGGKKLVNFGHDRTYNQTVTLSTRLLVPPVLKLDKILTPSFRYSSRYDWQNNFQAGILGKNAGRNVNITGGLDVTLKVIADEIWGTKKPAVRQPTDTTASGPSMQERLDQLTRILFKIPIFDWDKLTISLTQSNSARNSGVLGQPGFLNLFGRVPFAQESLDGYGPSLLYQLGLSSDPHGDVVVTTKGRFPFVTGYSVPGRRAPGGNLTDIYSQNNTVTMRTQRSLWDGARLDLSWTLSWSHNLNRTIRTDSLGIPTELSRTVSGDVTRSFVTFPNAFVFSMFKTGVEEVNKRFDELKRDRDDGRGEDVKLTQAFEEGMEAFSIGRKLISSLMPRPNWSFQWDGLEKLSVFSGFASRVSLAHGYTSTIRRRWRLTPNGGEVTESESVMYGFTPLVGVTITFKGVGKGSLTANVRYNTSTATDLSPAVQTITESNTSDITITGNFTQRGFEFPLFGLSLSNDLDINFSYSYSRNNRRAFDFRKPFKEEGDPLEGTIRTIIEPRIRYTLSSRVSASVYYKYTRLKPDEGGSRIPGSTINEGGLDIRLQIS